MAESVIRESCKCGSEIQVTLRAWMAREFDTSVLDAWRVFHALCYRRTYEFGDGKIKIGVAPKGSVPDA